MTTISHPPSPSSRSASATHLKSAIIDALEGQHSPVRLTTSYRLAIAVVAALMILLPLIYVALIGIVGYGVYWHLVHDTGILQANVRGKGKALLVLAYLAPAFAGVVIIAFMLKPLFARRRESMGDLETISREDEPFLFEFVDQLCDAIGAPHPQRILLDGRVNAAAALTSSVWNPFRYELMLVIGLPLVAGLNLKQFAGVLAHEFGHFSQGTGMRLGRIIDSINMWFAFVVYQRDHWDETLEQWAQSSNLQYGWVLHFARGCVWLTRQILLLLMKLGHAMSRRLSREMEFDADRHDMWIAGSDSFVETCRRLPILMGAQRWVEADVGDMRRSKRLVDDLFGLIAFRADQIPEPMRQQLWDEALQRETRWWDTHPSDTDRIASARRANSPGILNVDAPAAVLFRDFAATCREETGKIYHHMLDGNVPAASLQSLAAQVTRHLDDKSEDLAINRVLCEQYHYIWAFPFPTAWPQEIPSAEEVKSGIRVLRTRLRTNDAAYREQIRALFHHDALLSEANVAEALLHADMTVGDSVFTVPMTTLQQVANVRKQAQTAKDDAAAALAPYSRDLVDRLLLPLQLLSLPGETARIPNAAELRSTAEELIASEVRLRPVRPDLLKAYHGRDLIRELIRQLNLGGNPQKLVPAVLDAARDGVQHLISVQQKLSGIPYPFDDAPPESTVATFLIPDVPSEKEPHLVEEALSYVANEGVSISKRSIGQLCLLVETIEAAVGLPRDAERVRND